METNFDLVCAVHHGAVNDGWNGSAELRGSGTEFVFRSRNVDWPTN